MTIYGTPKGYGTWSYFLEGEGHHGSVDLNRFTERGSLMVDGALYEIKKLGVFSGCWSMNEAGKELTHAQKLGPLTRSFALTGAEGLLTLRVESTFGLAFGVEQDGVSLARISRAHLFTRSATIQRLSKADVPSFTTITFCFWLVAQLWRRAD